MKRVLNFVSFLVFILSCSSAFQMKQPTLHPQESIVLDSMNTGVVAHPLSELER
jgi:hypothetical protein